MKRDSSTKLGFNFLLAILVGALAASSVEAAQVVVNALPSARTVDSRHFALNAGIRDSRFEEPANLALLRDLGVRALRFPGGPISDDYHWAVNRTGTNTFNWACSFTDFARVVTNLGAQAIITVICHFGFASTKFPWPVIIPLLLIWPAVASNQMLSKAIGEPAADSEMKAKK